MGATTRGLRPGLSLVFSIVAAQSACGQQSDARLATSDAVCSAVKVVLDSIGAANAAQPVVIQTPTVAYRPGIFTDQYLSVLRALPGVSASTWSSFQEQNRAPQNVCPRLAHEGPPPVDRESEWWTGFHSRHPPAAGLATVSGPGMNPEQTQILLVVSLHVSAQAGSRYRVVLDRPAKSDVWRISRMRMESLGD